jgi:S1-C subfamily serine protease
MNEQPAPNDARLDPASLPGGTPTGRRLAFVRRIHVRAVLLALVALVAVGGGAAYAATRAPSKPIGTGVVVIDTSIAYQNASAAGTGIVLTPSGEILTNNHVIAGATTIRVVVPGTKHSYAATVVGYDTVDDVAVLQLENATNLKPATLGSSSTLRLGARVTAVGNAGGTGTLTFAQGTVTGLSKSITVQSDSGDAERLSGLIETNAALQPGDSGGPLVDSAGRVVGMDTAASTGSGFADYGTSDGYAIPINTALSIARKIEAGKSSVRVHVGGTPFLGVEIGSNAFYGDSSGATIAGVVSGGSADDAGLGPGDVITAIDGTSVTGPDDLASAVLAHQPGDKVTVTFTDTSGLSRTTTLTLASGPPQ